MSETWTSRLRIAVLLTYPTQLLDMAGIDLFGMASKEYMSNLPGPMTHMGIDVQIFYIGSAEANGVNEGSEDPPNATLRRLTADAEINAAQSISSASVQPGEVDILMIPGPPPSQKLDEEVLDFVRKHARHGTTILVICTGCFIAAQAGILDKRKASAPRALVPQLRKDFARVQWDDERRFVKDTNMLEGVSEGELWTSGGICNGLEMIAAFLREKIPGPLSEIICTMADVGDKGEFYEMDKHVETTWWIGQVLRALFLGKKASRVKQVGK